MAAITAAQIWTKRDAIMTASTRASVIVLKPDATSDATAAVFLIKDCDPGDTAVTTSNAQGNAKGGTTGGYSWKEFSYADAATAYGV